MKAYRMKRQGESDKNSIVRIVNGNEIVKDHDGVFLEKINGPIGGKNILPLNVGDKDEFVPFKLDDGTSVTTEQQMKSIYDSMYTVVSKQTVVNEVVEVSNKPEGSMGLPVIIDGEDEADDDVEVDQKPRRGRPKKSSSEDIEDEDDDE